MSVVAAAIIGSAVVGGVVASSAAKEGGDAVREGSANAADATIQSTEMQIEEIRRQFDYQSQILLPQIQEQYNAQRAYSDLMGIGGPQAGVNDETGFFAQARPDAVQQERRDAETAVYQEQLDAAQAEMDELQLTDASVGGAFATMRRQEELQTTIDEYQTQIDQVASRPSDQETIDAENAARGPRMGPQGSSGVNSNRRADGSFVDPNLDPTKLADNSAYRDSVEGNLLSGTGNIEDDAYNNYLRDNQIASGNIEDDTMVGRTNDVRIADGAAGQGVYGENFQESVGYDFAREEMNRATDRIGSAGGPNIGGRAIMEAQRRAKGLADQEYYNWAGGRERDLGRQGDAEAADISRGDQAYSGYENQRIADVSRNDQGYQDYLRRIEKDAARLDEAGSQEDRLRASDLARSDQGYYNYLNSLGRVAQYGGGSAATAVNASQSAGAQVAGAYDSQGRQLSSNYADAGVSQANVAYAGAAGINNAVQGGVENYIAGDPSTYYGRG